MFSRPLIVFVVLLWTISSLSLFFLFYLSAGPWLSLSVLKMAINPFCVLPTTLPVSQPRRTFAFRSSSRLLTRVRLCSVLRNACKFGQGHLERLREIQDLPGLCCNSIFALAHQVPKPDPLENSFSMGKGTRP